MCIRDSLGGTDAPRMPEDPQEDPVRYAQCMRLLWLAASMKSCDVIVTTLPTDDDNVALCELVSDMLPMLDRVHIHQRQPPQVFISLNDETRSLEGLNLDPCPTVMPASKALPYLVVEVLHPHSHWTGFKEDAEEDKAK